ncbi:hypothetical protein [Actinomarinicola tropica]|uniref:DUF4352 domain-containing protein n=1 Tax=Actinomarinicola tropica TaxID=2789776 RepID=A0A5Q2RBX6_9ACTN|nr:hypothetical protein [Actinomarinicola tropica]QGG94379.1 hypothetical protein GH723_04260 [Actinomarinicola tropica]
MTTTSPSPDAPSEPTSRSWFSKKRVLVPLAFVAGLVVGVAAGGTESDDADAAGDLTTTSEIAESTSTEDDLADDTAPSSTTEKPAPSTSTTAASAERGSRGTPLAIGETAPVGDYEVTVVGFTSDATAQVLEANQFNDPPADGEVYALVRVRATYGGDGEGFAGMDLSVGYIGNDGRIYVDHDCMAVEPDQLMDQPSVVAGGTVEGNLCLRMPASVLGSGAIFVEPLFSFDDERVWWAES